MDLDVHLAAIVSGDARAFGLWMAGAEGAVRATLRSFAAVVDVEAVLQEALLRVWQVAPRFAPDGRPNGLLRLAIRIARNLAISEVRRAGARAAAATPPDELAELAEAPAVRGPDPLLRRALAECRELLPARPREAFDARLRGEGGRDDADLATALGMRLNTFLQNVTRARKLLAACLGRKGITVDVELGA